MEAGILKIVKWRSSSQNVRILLAMRTYSNVPDLKKEEHKSVEVPRLYPNLMPQYWSEQSALKKRRKEHDAIKSTTDFLRCMQDLKNFPRSFRELFEYIKKRRERKDLINQKFLARREITLRPDLAAAHFIVQRGGSVKFLGQPQWIGVREAIKTLPFAYVPGIHIEAINAERTRLCYEGLENIRKLQHIRYLSLRNLDGVDDWCLDWVSKEFYATLKHLDISHCKNVTYRGLSCFYRFECLKSLDLEGVPDTPELKLACLMLLEVMPNLDIRGINLNIPDKIDPVSPEETKHLSSETKLISDNDKSEKVKQVSKV